MHRHLPALCFTICALCLAAPFTHGRRLPAAAVSRAVERSAAAEPTLAATGAAGREAERALADTARDVECSCRPTLPATLGRWAAECCLSVPPDPEEPRREAKAVKNRATAKWSIGP